MPGEHKNNLQNGITGRVSDSDELGNDNPISVHCKEIMHQCKKTECFFHSYDLKLHYTRKLNIKHGLDVTF